MVGVVQLAEHRIVVPGVVGSSPITHPIKQRVPNGILCFYMGLERRIRKHTGGCASQIQKPFPVLFVETYLFLCYNKKNTLKAGEEMACSEDAIAVFDSGVGGISVLRELIKLMPQENYLYFGDSANAPYGDKSTKAVRSLCLQAAEMLLHRNTKALVIACNTATAAAIHLLRQQYPNTIIIGIEPALKLATDHFPCGRIGIMATQVTLREEKLAHQMERFPQAEILRIPAPGLVEQIESGRIHTPETETLLANILSPYRGNLDALVLGCTHYPFVKDIIAKILGPEVLLLDGGEGTARQTQRCLTAAGLIHDGPGSITIENSLSTPESLQLSHKLLEL